MMKKKLPLLLILVLLASVTFAQAKPLSSLVINEFSRHVNYYFKYNDATRVLISESIRRQCASCSQSDIAVMVEKLAINETARNMVFKGLYDFTNGNEDFLFANLQGFELSASSSKSISSFIIQKYRAIEDRNDKADAARKVRLNDDLLNQYINGKELVETTAESLKLVLNQSEVGEHLNMFSANHDAVHVTYNIDSLKNYLPKYFQNEPIIFMVSNKGQLVSVENETGTVKLSISDHPFLKGWIQFEGVFRLQYKGQWHPVNYRYRALEISSIVKNRVSNYYFSIGKNQIENNIDQSAMEHLLKNKNTDLANIEYENYYDFSKKEIEKSLFAYSGTNNYKDLKKVARIDFRSSGRKLLNLGLSVGTGIPVAGLDKPNYNENCLRFIKMQKIEVTSLNDRIGVGNLNIEFQTRADEAFNLEAYNLKYKAFQKVVL